MESLICGNVYVVYIYAIKVFIKGIFIGFYFRDDRCTLNCEYEQEEFDDRAITAFYSPYKARIYHSREEALDDIKEFKRLFAGNKELDVKAKIFKFK